jgi:hypothetical protein
VGVTTWLDYIGSKFNINGKNIVEESGENWVKNSSIARRGFG